MTSLDKQRDRDDRPGQEWATLTATGPYAPRIGSALITLVEPHVGHEAAYNRWYEDDHYISGAMAFPWVFAGRRWVATRDLQLLRYPASSPIADPVTAGCYLSTYWLVDGRYKEQFYWATATNNRLNADGRGFDEHRTHVFTNYQYYNGATYRPDVVSRDVHALSLPFLGLVLDVIDANDGVDRDDLDAWLATDYLPSVTTGPVAMSLRWEPIPMPVRKGEGVKVLDTPALDRRLTILHFLDVDPRECWQDAFAGNGDRVAAGGLGTTTLAAPFIPTIPGTDRYVDELR
jgi:hypothetical protein